MIRCPKCSHHSISGPHYERDVLGEALRYRCNRCGYSETEPTDDADKSQSLARAAQGEG